MLKVKGQGHVVVQVCGGKRHVCWQRGVIKVSLLFNIFTMNSDFELDVNYVDWTMSLSNGLNVFQTPKCHVLFCVVDAGYNCEENVDSCHPNPCIHGKCIDRVGGYQCVCHLPYSGLNCLVLLDPYMPDQCRNGAAHVLDATYSTFFCQCPTGYTGNCCCPHHNLELFDDKCVV